MSYTPRAPETPRRTPNARSIPAHAADADSDRGSQCSTPRDIRTGRRMDAKTLQLVVESIKDRIYQRSFNLRKTFRQLDVEGHGKVSFKRFKEEMSRAFQLSDLELQGLDVLMTAADFNHDGMIDYREFCAMLKMQEPPSNTPVLSQAEKTRFQGKGLMDPQMQKLILKDPSREISVQGGRPTNELGPMLIPAPFGVLGDSERMDAVIKSFVDYKYAGLRSAFQPFDPNNTGFVTRDQFRQGMKALDKYVFDEEVDALLEVLDAKKKNRVDVEVFVRGIGQEYLKKKAHRSNAHQNPFVWAVPEGTSHGASAVDSPRGHSRTPRAERADKPARKLKKAGMTRASELRANEAKQKLQEIFRRENEEQQWATAYAGSSTPRMPKIQGKSIVSQAA